MNPKSAMKIVVTSLVLMLSFVGYAKDTTKSGDFYEVKVETRQGGHQTIATVKASPKSGYHCNTQYPWKLTIAEIEGLKTAKTVLKKKDAKQFSKDVVIFEVPYSVPQGKEVKGALKFSMCDEKQCKMERLELTL